MIRRWRLPAHKTLFINPCIKDVTRVDNPDHPLWKRRRVEGNGNIKTKISTQHTDTYFKHVVSTTSTVCNIDGYFQTVRMQEGQHFTTLNHLSSTLEDGVQPQWLNSSQPPKHHCVTWFQTRAPLPQAENFSNKTSTANWVRCQVTREE